MCKLITNTIVIWAGYPLVHITKIKTKNIICSQIDVTKTDNHFENVQLCKFFFFNEIVQKRLVSLQFKKRYSGYTGKKSVLYKVKLLVCWGLNTQYRSSKAFLKEKEKEKKPFWIILFLSFFSYTSLKLHVIKSDLFGRQNTGGKKKL